MLYRSVRGTVLRLPDISYSQWCQGPYYPAKHVPHCRLRRGGGEGRLKVR